MSWRTPPWLPQESSPISARETHECESGWSQARGEEAERGRVSGPVLVFGEPVEQVGVAGRGEHEPVHAMPAHPVRTRVRVFEVDATEPELEPAQGDP